MADVTGEFDLRKENVDGAIKAIALQEYKLKTLCSIDSSSAWTESYYRETNTELSASGEGNTIKGIPRNANFPYAEVSFTKLSALNEKYGLEGTISYEDKLMNNIPVISRTLVRIGRAVTKSVDDAIAAEMLASAGNTLAIGAGNEWDSATVANRDPVFNILQAIQLLRADNIDALAGNGTLVLNGTDYTNLISNTKFTNNPSFKTADVVSNGIVGQVAGLDIMVTESLEVSTPDVAYVVMAREAMTWKQVTALTTVTEDTPGIETTIRAFELGHVQVHSPNGICKITNTRA